MSLASCGGLRHAEYSGSVTIADPSGKQTHNCRFDAAFLIHFWCLRVIIAHMLLLPIEPGTPLMMCATSYRKLHWAFIKGLESRIFTCTWRWA